MWLIITLLILTAISYWAGFVAPHHPVQHQSKSGFVIFIALTVFVVYFTFQQTSSVDELAKIIQPVPEITKVSFIQGFDKKLETFEHIEDTIPEKKQHVQYWIIQTRLSTDAVADFYRNSIHFSGWTIESEQLPWLRFFRKTDKLVIYISDNGVSYGSKVIYTLTQN